MPAIPSVATQQERWWRSTRKHLNFYRVHILFFTFTPLIFSGIFYASNGKFQISYIDSLFNCVSAMTVCGLATVDLSSLTPWQQVILFIQMCMGSPVVVSWFMVFLRRHYFARKFQYIIDSTAASKAPSALIPEKPVPWYRRPLLHRGHRPQDVKEEGSDDNSDHRGSVKRLRTDMIRRMDDAPKLVDPSGWISEGRSAVPLRRSSTVQSAQEFNRHLSFAPISPERRPASLNLNLRGTNPRRLSRRLSDPGTPSRQNSIKNAPMQRFETIGVGTLQHRLARTPITDFRRTQTVEFGRTQTVEFAPLTLRRRPREASRILSDRISEIDAVSPSNEDQRTYRTGLNTHASLPTHYTGHSYKPTLTKHSGFGGFPMPHEIIGRVVNRFFPGVKRQLTRTVTVPLTTTIASQRGGTTMAGAKMVPYISFDAVVGRNSAFPYLTNNQIEELGGVEYRALNALLWIVAGYHFGLQLLSFIVIAPYMARAEWSANFVPPALHQKLNTTWFSAFQVVSSYTNTGMSLVDTSMVPFQKAYPMIVFMIILILAGNTAFPIFLRLTIWTLTKLVPKDSRANETLHFLLDHPRRCFIYLFPSHQTWFLVTIVLFLNFTDWFFFMVLDIGTPAIEIIPLGTRFVAGLLQAIAVRAAGFGTVTLAALAPAVKVLYVVMMYVSVYPIAMSVRSTNVYEEQSLGVFQEESDNESEFQATGPRVVVWSRYLAMHARKQLAFDMWWLGLALFLVCIIERDNLEDVNNLQWFNIFNVVFELVSAYGTVGLSLGLPYANYSFSGDFRTLSKLIVILVMLRGRHRGLPVAIDRAVMFPMEFKRDEVHEDDDLDEPMRSHTFTNTPNGRVEEKSVNGDSFDLRQRSARPDLAEEEDEEDPRTRRQSEEV